MSIDSLADQLELPSGSKRMPATSPQKMLLQDLASGQANIGTPLRSRLDSQDSRLGVAYPGLKCDETLMGHKAEDSQFKSPNDRGKTLNQAEDGLYYGANRFGRGSQ